MRPALFNIGDLTIHSWSFMFALSVILVLFLSIKYTPEEDVKHHIGKRSDILIEYALEALVLGLFLAAVGSRLFFVITHPEQFVDAPWWRIFAFWEGGMVYHGGLYAVFIGEALYCKARELPFWETVDYLLPFVSLGYAVSRIGCFLNGCCYGHETELPWGMVFPAVDSLARHPTQLYSFALMLLISYSLRKLWHTSPYKGYIFSWFLVMYGTYRLLVEFLRVSPPVVWIFSLAQVTSIVFILIGVGILIFKKVKTLKSS